MTSRSSSSPSEGEIFESDSEKATTSLNLPISTSVDRPFRKRSVSQSPSPDRSSRHYYSRTQSRSPYRESRGTKRPLDDKHYDRARNDPRRFRVRYEDRLSDARSRPRGSDLSLSRYNGLDQHVHYDDRGAKVRARDRGPRKRSRSPPYLKTRQLDDERSVGSRTGNLAISKRWNEQGDRAHHESGSRLFQEQSVSDRSHLPVATAHAGREAENHYNQTQHVNDSTEYDGHSIAKYVIDISLRQSADRFIRSALGQNATEEKIRSSNATVVDEVILIEERRKKREAIKAKHRGQATPMLVQALALDSKMAPSTTSMSKDDATQERGEVQGISILSYLLNNC